MRLKSAGRERFAGKQVTEAVKHGFQRLRAEVATRRQQQVDKGASRRVCQRPLPPQVCGEVGYGGVGRGQAQHGCKHRTVCAAVAAAVHGVVDDAQQHR